MNILQKLFGLSKKGKGGGSIKNADDKESLPNIGNEKPVKEVQSVEPQKKEAISFNQFTIKEIMVQKNVTREKAIEILKNPKTE